MPVLTLRDILEPAEWMVDALCRQIGGDLFYPETGETAVEPKRVCARCDVRAQCLAYALEHDEQEGVWGGKSVRERNEMTGRHQPGARTEWCGCGRGPFSERGLRTHRSLAHRDAA